MFSRSSAIRFLVPALAGALCLPLAHGQTISIQPNRASQITISVNGLTCGAPAASSFAASAFHFAVTDTVSTGGDGAQVGKIVFSDLLVQKQSDSCSLPLVLLASKGLHISQVVLRQVDKSNKPVVTMVLDDVIIVSTQVAGLDSAASAPEEIAFSYGAITVTDAAGVTTGRITR